ncbi:MAG: 4Fe-4S binding protein [Clostridiales bacterium]|nr:4Fe-4S binding protein [Clostridiales bacterium]
MMAATHDTVDKKVILRFSPELVEQPIVYQLVKEFDLIPNIIRAEVSPEKKGFLLLGLSGREADYRRALLYLEEEGLQVQSLVEQVSWDEERCTQCGLCTGVCPSGALYLERPSLKVCFEGEKCVVCNMCIEACPAHAMRLDV